MESRGDYMKRSKSNHNMGRKKSQKKTKKTKSLSRVSELDKDIVIDDLTYVLHDFDFISFFYFSYLCCYSCVKSSNSN